MSRLSSCKPKAIALLVCDHVFVDPTTKQKTLLGLYPHVVAESFPAPQPRLWFFLSFMGAAEPIDMRLRLIRVGASEPLFEVGGRMDCSDERLIYDFLAAIENVTFAEPGEYRLEAFAGDVLFDVRALFVTGRTHAGAPAVAFGAG